MIKDVAEFKVQYVQVMDDEGNAKDEEVPELSHDEIRTMYWYMVLGRALDRKMLTLQRQGRLGTFASTEGQEACQVGSASQLRKEDWMVIAFRENVACLVRGIPMVKMLQYWGGDERGSLVAEDQRTLPVSIPVGSQPLHAVGLGFSERHKGTDNVSLVYFGDGATSEGEFHEAMNLGSLFATPTVFFCQDNQYAISVPREKQSHSSTLAQKAIAYGMPGVQVDGNDVFAVYKVTKDAIERARRGEGPTLIEAVTYRLGNHTTSDDYKHYRQEEEVEQWRKKDPVDRLRKFMQRKGFWSDKDEEEAWNHAKELVEESVAEYEALDDPAPEEFFDHLYEKLPLLIEEQKAEFVKYAKGGDDR